MPRLSSDEYWGARGRRDASGRGDPPHKRYFLLPRLTLPRLETVKYLPLLRLDLAFTKRLPCATPHLFAPYVL